MSDFESFCSRMWLDNEDENLSPHAAGNRLTRDEYIERWYDWLLDKYQNRDLKEDEMDYSGAFESDIEEESREYDRQVAIDAD